MLMLVAALLVSAQAPPVSAVVVPAHDVRQWKSYRWGRLSNLSVPIIDNTGPAWTASVAAADANWSKAASVGYRVLSGAALADPVACPPTYGFIRVCSANYGKTGWIGWTQLFTKNGFIVMATSKLNDYYATTSKAYAQPAWYQATACHELGHALGLDHSDSARNNRNIGSCLDITSDPSGKNKNYGPLTALQPSVGDLDALNRIYGSAGGVQLETTNAPK